MMINKINKIVHLEINFLFTITTRAPIKKNMYDKDVLISFGAPQNAFFAYLQACHFLQIQILSYLRTRDFYANFLSDSNQKIKWLNDGEKDVQLFDSHSLFLCMRFKEILYSTDNNELLKF